MMQLVLEPLWKAYEAVEPGADVKSILGKMVKGLGLQQARKLSQLLPISSCVPPNASFLRLVSPVHYRLADHLTISMGSSDFSFLSMASSFPCCE